MFQLDQLSSEIERAALRWYMAELRYGKICKLPKLGKELFMLCAKRHINRRTSLVSSKEPAPSKESKLVLSEEQVGHDYFLVMSVTEGRLLGGDDVVRAVLAVGRLMNQALAAIAFEHTLRE